jgi:hypothetical protein
MSSVSGGLFCSGSALNYSTSAISALGLTAVSLNSQDAAGNVVDFVIADYDNLTSLSFPKLAEIGSNFVLTRNPMMRELNGFEALARITGNLDITGSFDTLSLPNLQLVSGSVNIQTTSSNFTCPISNQGMVQGNFVCRGNVANPQPLSNGTTVPLNQTTTQVGPTSTSISSTSTSTASSTSQTTESRSAAISTKSCKLWKIRLI